MDLAFAAVAGLAVGGTVGFVIGLFDGAQAVAATFARRWLELHPEDADVQLDPRRGRGSSVREWAE